MYPRWIWRALALPGIAWLVLFFVVAFYAILAVAFGTFDEFFDPVPYWNPLDWNVGWFNQIGQQLAPGETYFRLFTRTLVYVVCAVALSFVIGYPVAYYVSRRAGRWRGLFLLLIVLPFWISYLMRMFAWINLLSPGGYVERMLSALSIDRAFEAVGLLDDGAGWLDGQAITVIIALAYGYVPFLILPLFASLDRIDERTIEAARDLGASPRSAFFRVTLPLSLPGAFAGLVLIALPMFGDYYTPDLVSGSPQTFMIGNQIDLSIRTGTSKPLGAALTVALSAMLVVLMALYLRQTMRATREVER